MVPFPTRAAVCAAAAVALVSGLLAAVGGTPGAVAAGTYCSNVTPGLTTFVWGGGSGSWHGGDWEDTAGNAVGEPGQDPGSAGTDYVCIDAGPAGGVVLLDYAPQDVKVAAIDVAPGTTLRMAPGGRLFVHGDPTDVPSVVRGRLVVDRTYLGGPGLIRVQGTMNLVGVSTLTSDTCVLTTPCPGAAGELVVAPDATLSVTGRGTNISHGYRVTVIGTLRLSGTASYIAADRATTITIRAGGLLDLRNNGGIYEGITHQPGDALASLVNAGTIAKTAGDGVSALNVTYSRVGAGRVLVESGTVTLPQGARGVTVAARRTFGTGSCRAGVTAQCTPALTPSDDEFGRIVPSARVAVSVSEGTSKVSSRDVAPPFTFALGRRLATRVTLAYARALIGSRTSATVWRAPTPRGTYTRVPTCVRGNIPSGKSTCFVAIPPDRVRHPGGAKILVKSTVGGSLVTR